MASRHPLRKTAFVGNRQLLAKRTHRYDLPSTVPFRAITEDVAAWVVPRPGEVLPVVLEAHAVKRVVWASMWPVSPADTVEFELDWNHRGTSLCFEWWSDQPPDERGIGIPRQRLNRLLGSDIRGWFTSPDAWRPDEWDLLHEALFGQRRHR
jgi:hypothetical protein